MPDSIFFTESGDAVHGFFDTPHLGMAVSHGCVRLSPANAAVLYGLVEQTGLSDTTVIVHGRIPTHNAPIVARRQAPKEEASNGAPKRQRAQINAAVEHDQLASEHDALGQLIKHLLEAPHPVAVARDLPAATL
jgi:hypothetical protein